MPYKTTLLGGRWDLGATGIRVFGALWALAAAGFVAPAAGLLAGSTRWRPLVIAVALFSLALTALDWTVAYAGVIANVAILAGAWLWPRP